MQNDQMTETVFEEKHAGVSEVLYCETELSP